MAILSTAKIVGMLASAKKTGKQVMNAAGEWVAEVVEDFMSGFAGHGWKIWEYVSGKWKLEIDSIVVRETMTVFELLIQKIRAVKGALGITQANGKIKSAILDDAKQNWLIIIEEDEMSFVAHDIIRCQNWQNGTLKGYWVEISEIRKIDGVDTIVIPVSEFSGSIDYIDGMEAVVSGLSDMSIPTEGDEIIQFGNTININRQSAIYLHADEGGQPAIDILFGINSKSFAGCVKMRIGGDIPGANGLKGFYCENGLIKGTDSSGHTVYCIYPDGTAEFGDGSAQFAADKSGKLAGGAISWEWYSDKKKYVCTMGDVILGWDNLSPEAKENLKGADGKDAVLFQIEFYINGTRISNIPCDIHGTSISDNIVIAKLYRINGSSKEDYTPEKWRVSYLKEGVEVLSNQPLESLNFINISLDKSLEYDSIAVMVYEQSIPDYVLITEASISKVMANVPDWFVGWDTNKVQIGGEYMISPKLFTGKNTGTAEEPILTGIVQGDNCLTINGETKSGFYGIKENEIVFSIDSDTADVSTVGDVIANAIKATGLNVNDKFKVDKDGIISSKGSVFDGVYVEGFICSKFSTSFDVDEHEYPKTMNYIVNEGTQLNISLPNDDKYIGAIMTVFLNRNLSSEGMIIGGNVSYNGKRITPLIKNKGTILRLMATYKVNNDLYWEVINFDNRNFALVNLTAVEGSNILFLLDRTTSANPDKSMSGTLKELSDYWDTI